MEKIKNIFKKGWSITNGITILKKINFKYKLKKINSSKVIFIIIKPFNYTSTIY